MFDALLFQDKIAFLDGKALQLYDLSNHQVTVISQFDQALFLWGFMLYDEPGNQLVYWVIMNDNDPQADLTRGTIVGFYDLAHHSQRELPQFHYSLTVLGFDAGHHNLFIHGFGDDPDFRGISEVDPQDGHMVAEINVEGYGDVTLSPAMRWLAAEGVAISPDQTQRWWQWRLYDMMSTPPTLRVIPLPHPPSHISMHFWSADSQILYFFLVKGDTGDVGVTTGSYGFWPLDVNKGELTQVAKIEDYTYGGIDLGGPWILLAYSAINQPSILLNRYTGQHAYLDLPEYPKFVRGGKR